MIRKFFRSGALAFAFAVLLTTNALAGHGNIKVEMKDLKVGTGAQAVRHSNVTVHYTGWTLDGKKFDSSVDRGEPFQFVLGAGNVIPGWDMGVEGMKVGGKRELIIPPQLAYGESGAGDAIGPNATLKFEVELLAVAPPSYSNVGNGQLKELLARGVKIVDVRRAEEWRQTGVVEGSKLVTAFNEQGQFDQSFIKAFRDFASPEDEVILIGGTGSRSSVMAQALSDQIGYKKVFNVTGGIVKWVEEGNDVVKP